MDSVVRGLVIYGFLLVVFRLAGTRTMAQMTSFDFVLLLIISEATQQAMLGGDDSLTNAMVLILTLVGADIALSLLKERSRLLGKAVDGTPVVIVEHGRPREELMRELRVDLDDVLAAARELRGLERLDQIEYAVLERSGGITIVPARPA